VKRLRAERKIKRNVKRNVNGILLNGIGRYVNEIPNTISIPNIFSMTIPD
jgi:hypothetical protein